MLVPLERTTIWRIEREGRFPQSRRIGKSAKAWLEAEVIKWRPERVGDVGAQGLLEIGDSILSKRTSSTGSVEGE